jgi:hypothetical protein
MWPNPLDSNGTTVITMTGASQRSADAASLQCVSAKSLISKATDARTQLTHDSQPNLRGRSGRAKGDTRAPASLGRERKDPGPNAKRDAERSLAFGQLLDSKGTERTERTERKNAESF